MNHVVSKNGVHTRHIFFLVWSGWWSGTYVRTCSLLRYLFPSHFHTWTKCTRTTSIPEEEEEKNGMYIFMTSCSTQKMGTAKHDNTLRLLSRYFLPLLPCPLYHSVPAYFFYPALWRDIPRVWQEGLKKNIAWFMGLPPTSPFSFSSVPFYYSNWGTTKKKVKWQGRQVLKNVEIQPHKR